MGKIQNSCQHAHAWLSKVKLKADPQMHRSVKKRKKPVHHQGIHNEFYHISDGA